MADFISELEKRCLDSEYGLGGEIEWDIWSEVIDFYLLLNVLLFWGVKWERGSDITKLLVYAVWSLVLGDRSFIFLVLAKCEGCFKTKERGGFPGT